MTKLDEIFQKHSNLTALSEGNYGHIMDDVDFKAAALEFAKHILEEVASEYQRVVTFESDSEEYVKQSITDTLNKYL